MRTMARTITNDWNGLSASQLKLLIGAGEDYRFDLRQGVANAGVRRMDMVMAIHNRGDLQRLVLAGLMRLTQDGRCCITDQGIGILNTLFHEKIMSAVTAERQRQNKKWGEQNHESLKWLAIAGEEFGEVAKDILEDNKSQMLEEIVQLIAVLVAWTECEMRHGEKLP